MNTKKMNMKTKSLLIALSVAMLSLSVARAQKVGPGLDFTGNPIIDCSLMPLKAFTDYKKGQSAEALLISDEANKTICRQFSVSNIDNHAGQLWKDAFTTCKKLGNAWRLPTQRELMLIWVLRTELEARSGFQKFAAANYCSATESDDNSYWCVSFNYGGTNTNSKSNHGKVRCIREFSY